MVEGFSEYIGEHIRGGRAVNRNNLVINQMSDVEVAYVDVLCLSVLDRVVGKGIRAIVITDATTLVKDTSSGFYFHSFVDFPFILRRSRLSRSCSCHDTRFFTWYDVFLWQVRRLDTPKPEQGRTSISIQRLLSLKGVSEVKSMCVPVLIWVYLLV
jgi:hypothetical protein